MSEDRHSGIPGGGNGFAYEYSEAVESDTPTTSTSSSTETVHTHTVATAGDYIVMWSFELGYASNANHIEGRVYHNGARIAAYTWEYEDVVPDPYTNCSGFKKLTLAIDDTIELTYGAETSGSEKRMRRCRVLLIAA